MSRLIAAVMVAALGALLSLPLAEAELDLSPRVETSELDGVQTSELAFDTGKSARATYQPPRDWKCSGTNGSLDLTPAKTAQARARITKLPPGAPLSFDPEGCRKLTQLVISSLPEGSQQVKVEAEELSPLQIDGMPTYLVELSYVYYTETLSSYCLFLDRKPEAMRFQLTCRRTDYQALRRVFQKSLYSWQNLEIASE